MQSSEKRYRVLLRGKTDTTATHIWCAGIVVPGEPVWRTVDAETLEKLRNHTRIEILDTEALE